jgi:Tol biopolymer transport system component
LPRGREVALVKADGQDDRTILSLQTGEFVADVALSPDRSRVAFGLFTARTGGGPGGSDIVIASAEPGGERTMVAPRDRPGMLLAAPYWSPDGQGLIFEAVGLGASNLPTITADWINLDGSGRRTIAALARYPSISPDGKKVVYTLAKQTGDALVEQPLAGGEAREIIPEGDFLVIAYPRYSPDGSQIAFAGVGDSIMTGPPGLPLLPEPASSPASPKLLPDSGQDDWRGVAAHGFPADPWIISTAGGEARRLAQLPVDDAAIAWSPDGSVVATCGAAGIFMVDATDGSSRRVSENGSFGAIDWR